MGRAYFILANQIKIFSAKNTSIATIRNDKHTNFDDNSDETSPKIDMEDYKKPDNEVPNLSTVRLSLEEIPPPVVRVIPPEPDEVEPISAKESTASTLLNR